MGDYLDLHKSDQLYSQEVIGCSMLSLETYKNEPNLKNVSFDQTKFFEKVYTQLNLRIIGI